jgi:hypothetical protein
MMTHTDTPLCEIENFLHSRGLECIKTDDEFVDGENRKSKIFSHNGRYVRISYSFRNSIGCEAYVGPETNMSDIEWRNIFSFTIPNFASFPIDEKIAWIASVPKGEEYTAYLISHIEKFLSKQI